MLNGNGNRCGSRRVIEKSWTRRWRPCCRRCCRDAQAAFEIGVRAFSTLSVTVLGHSVLRTRGESERLLLQRVESLVEPENMFCNDGKESLTDQGCVGGRGSYLGPFVFSLTWGHHPRPCLTMRAPVGFLSARWIFRVEQNK